MNVKLQHVISDVTGKTGLAIIDNIVSRERDPNNRTRLPSATGRSKLPWLDLRKPCAALQGNRILMGFLEMC